MIEQYIRCSEVYTLKSKGGTRNCSVANVITSELSAGRTEMAEHSKEEETVRARYCGECDKFRKCRLYEEQRGTKEYYISECLECGNERKKVKNGGD